MIAYWNECKRKRVVPEQYDEVPGMWQPADLPGKRGFDLARETLGSKVNPIVADFTSMDLKALAEFDVTLYLGVLYHMQDPFRCLKRLAQVTRELAIIESSAIHVPGYRQSQLWEFYETNELNADVSNWWGPSEAGLLGMCRAAGFSRVETVTPAPADKGLSSAVIDFARSRFGLRRKPVVYRIVVHAWK